MSKGCAKKGAQQLASSRGGCLACFVDRLANGRQLREYGGVGVEGTAQARIDQAPHPGLRLMAAAFGYRVTQLRRVRIINVKLGALKIGQWRNLTDAELKGLLPERTEW